jgi:hypothetical protein
MHAPVAELSQVLLWTCMTVQLLRTSLPIPNCEWQELLGDLASQALVLSMGHMVEIIILIDYHYHQQQLTL